MITDSTPVTTTRAEPLSRSDVLDAQHIGAVIGATIAARPPRQRHAMRDVVVDAIDEALQRERPHQPTTGEIDP